MPIELVRHAKVDRAHGSGKYDVLVIKPSKNFTDWMIRRAIADSILADEGVAVDWYGEENGSVILTLTSIRKALELLTRSKQLPDIRRIMERLS